MKNIDNDVVESMAMVLDILEDVDRDRVRFLAELVGRCGGSAARDEAGDREEDALVAMLVVLAPRYPSALALVDDALESLGE